VVRARSEWHIEQKMRRQRLAQKRLVSGSIENDDVIRATDGYAFVLAVRPGNRMPCPKCGVTLGIPS